MGRLLFLALPVLFCQSSYWQPEPFDLTRWDAEYHATHPLELQAQDTTLECGTAYTLCGVKIEPDDWAARTIRE